MPSDIRADHAGYYARYYLRLVRLAMQLVDDLETAEDVVQDVFASWPDGSTPEDPLRYLRTAVVNRSRSALRRRRTRRAFDRRPIADRPAEPADAEVLRNELSRAILACVDGLPRRQREVVILRYYEELAVGEFAVVLAIRPSAVSTALSRALTTLASTVEEHHDH